MMPAIAEPKLICPECRRENMAERIYCHDCGARLNRSALAKMKRKDEDPKETQRRLKTMLNPRGAKMQRRFFAVSKAVLGAGLIAALVQMLRPPDLPVRGAPSLAEMPTEINFELEHATERPGTGPLRYSEEQVNAYLISALKSKQTMLSKYLKFQRATLVLEEGTVRVTMERSLYGFSIFTTGIYAATLQDGKLAFRNLGGQIGRLPLHPNLMQYGDLIFADLATALQRERKLVVKLDAIELHPKQIVFVPKQS
ncbi:MAG: hypothetical protein ACXWG0_09065 [Chthoniobacterales bacterium]